MPLLLKLEDKFTVADGCWEWQASLRTGYGVIAGEGIGGKKQMAHRAIYELLVGPIPEGLDLDHLCRNRKCVRPSHLEPVTRQENLRRSPLVGKNSPPSATADHCRRGHLYTEDNTYIRLDNGFRQCKACGKERRVARAA